MDDDARWLARALGLGARAAPTSRPNPPVGCVLVRDGRVVGEGWTRPVGGPHAEVVALREAGDAARGATAYVTLEPCDHTGRTGPCSRALVDAGIARVVHALADPDPVAAGGAQTLRDAGVEVRLLPLAGWDHALPEAFLHDRRTHLPLVTVKLAVTPAGATVAEAGRWITGPVARRRVHRQRAAADAVLVGVGTVLADDPGLDVRHVPPPAAQPRPVVLDTTLRTPSTAAVVRRGALVVGRDDADEDRAARLRAAGAEVRLLPAGATGRVAPREALAAVRGDGRQTVYAEPGPVLAAALLDDGVVDHVLLHVGGVTPGEALEVVARAPLPLAGWRLVDAVRLAGDVEVALAPPRARP